MKNIFCLRGIWNVGKTATIIEVARMLLNNGYELSEEHFIDHELLKNKEGHFDFRVILKCSNDHSVLVGIESKGDPDSRSQRLRKSLDIFRKCGCRVIICATRTSGMTVDWVEDMRKHGYEINCTCMPCEEEKSKYKSSSPEWGCLTKERAQNLHESVVSFLEGK